MSRLPLDFNLHSPREQHIPDEIADAIAGAAANGDNATILRLLAERPKAVDVFDVVVYVHQTPLMHAAANGHLDTARLLIEHGASVNAMNEHGDTPVSTAAENGQPEILRLLIKKGADVNQAGDYNWTPLMGAAWRLQTETIRILLDNGADVNAKDLRGKTVVSHLKELEALACKRLQVNPDIAERQLEKIRAIIRMVEEGPRLKPTLVSKPPSAKP